MACDVLKETLGYDVPRSCTLLHFGNLTEETIKQTDIYFVKAVLAASDKAIIRKRYRKDSPTQRQGLDIVEEIYVMETITHT